MDVVDAEQARIAEDAGACAVMALERVPADIRRDGGVARMSDPEKIREIQEAVSIPVMAKCRIGHFVEAQILEALEVDYIDESEVLTPADVEHHVDKHAFTVPFVCGATNLGEALRRIAEGAAMIRTKGEAGTGDIVNAVTHMRSVFGAIRGLAGPARGGALRGREGAPRPVRAGALGRGERAPAGRHLHRRRASRRPPTRRSACSSAPTACSSARASSSPATRTGARRRSSRRRRTSTTRRSSPTSPRARRADGRHLREHARRGGAARSARLVAHRAGIYTSSRMDRRPRIGVLALQGAFREHARALRRAGADVVEVRLPEQLDGLDGLVIPGGESTTITKLARSTGSTRRSARSTARSSARARG